MRTTKLPHTKLRIRDKRSWPLRVLRKLQALLPPLLHDRDIEGDVESVRSMPTDPAPTDRRLTGLSLLLSPLSPQP